MTVARKLSFGAGVISEEFWGRIDQVRHQTGLAILKNWTVMKSGAVQNRTGTTYQSTIYDPTKTARLHEWVFDVDTTFKLELGPSRMAFWQNGDPILETVVNIQTSITQASPCVVHATAHGFVVGEKVLLESIGGMTQLNGRYYIVRTVPTADTFSLSYSGDGIAQGTAVDSTAFTAYTAGGTAKRVYKISTPYIEADLPDLVFAQSANQTLITHADYEPRLLTRTTNTSWTLAVLGNGPSTAYPTGVTATIGGSGSIPYYRYQVTAVSDSTGIESLPGISHVRTVNAITNANPAVVTVTATVAGDYETGDEIQMGTVTGMTEVSGRRFRIARLSTTTFQLVGENSTSYGAFTGTNSVYLTHVNLANVATPTTSTPHIITTSGTATAGVHYNVYKESGGIYGFIGSTSTLALNDVDQTPDTLTAPTIYREPFHGTGNYPATCAFYQERAILGGSDNKRNWAETSVIGDYSNYTIHSPHLDEDAVQFQTAGHQDSILNMASLDKLVMLTGGAEYVVAGGGEGGSLTPRETNIRPRTYNGSQGLFPLLIDSNILYLDRGGQVRDFHYSFVADNYQGLNRSLFVPDLLKGRTIVDWAYQRNPNSIIWAVRDDGVVLSMTYQPDQEMFGWAEHPFHGGTVENVCVVPEGSGETAEDAVYFIVARTLEDLSTTRYVERLSARTFTDIKDAKFVDCCMSFDGTGTGTVTLSGSGWTNATSLTATFSIAQLWSSSTVGDDIQINGLDDDGEAIQIRCRVTGYTSTTILTVIPHTTVPVAMQAIAESDWVYAPDSFSGLWPLEGQTVSVFGDGFVAASALNPTYETQYTVSDGAFTLTGDQRFGQVHIGLPITADVKTLRINPQENPNAYSNPKLVNVVAVEVSQTRGLWMGALEPTDDDADPIEFLYEAKVRHAENYGEPTALKTGIVKVRTKARWDTNGVFFGRMLEPLPATILSVAAGGDGF